MAVGVARARARRRHDQAACGVLGAAGAGQRVLAFREFDRELTRQARREVLLLADDLAGAVDDLELRDRVGAVVLHVERGRAGRHGDLGRIATGVGDGDLDGLAVAGRFRVRPAGGQERDECGRTRDRDDPPHEGSGFAIDVADDADDVVADVTALVLRRRRPPDAGHSTNSRSGIAARNHATVSATTGRGWIPSIPVARADCTEPGRMNELRSATCSCMPLSHPASWAVCAADANSPATTNTSTTPVTLKNLARLMRSPPLYNAKPMPTATTRPRTAPVPAAAVSSELSKTASKNTAVSSPSRNTARNAMITSAITEPSARAPARFVSMSPFSPRAFRRIHTIM